MPFMIPNFSGVAPLSSSVADMLPNLMAGYKLGRVPQQTGLEEEKMKLANLLQSEEIRKSGILNQFLPQREALGVQGLGLENQYKSIINRFLPGREAAGVSGLQLENVMKGLQNQFYPEESSSASALRRAQAEVAGLSPEQIAARKVFGKGSEDEYNWMAGQIGARGYNPNQTPWNPQNQGGQPQGQMGQGQPQGQGQGQPQAQQSKSQIPPGRTALQNYDPKQRADLINTMREEANKSVQMKFTAKKALKALKLSQKYPNLSRDLMLNLAQDKDMNTIKQWGAKRFTNKQELAAFEELNGLLNDIIKTQTESFGNSATDYKAKIIEKAKGNPGMEGQALQAILSNTLEGTMPYTLGYGDLVKDGLAKNYAVESHEVSNFMLGPGQSMYDPVTVKDPDTGEIKRVTRLDWYENQLNSRG